MNRILKRYRLVLLPLVLVLILDLSLLAMNYIISSELEISSININIAGRQRMLTQRMTKSLALIHYKINQSKSFESELAEINSAVDLFTQTLTAFYYGGTAISTSGQTIDIQPLEQPKIRKILNECQLIWLPIHKKLMKFILKNSFEELEAQKLIELLSVNNLKLLELMNELANQFERDAEKKIYFLKAIQTIIVIMILLSFAMATIRLIRRENYYDNLMEKSTDIIIGIDARNGNVTFISSSVKQLLGFAEEFYIGKSVLSLFSTESKRLFSEILGAVAKNNFLENDRCEVELVRRDGGIVVADMVMQLTLSEDGKSEELSVDIRDISERKKAELKLSEMVRKDDLTGLPNRKLFLELAEHSILRAKRYGLNFAILFIDLDGFKSINDTFGHQVGDKLLIHVADQLASSFRVSDCVARFGGDEFFVLVEEVGNKKELNRLCKKVIQLLSQPVVIDGSNVQVGASIGVSIYPKNADSIEELINKADAAMYQVKQSGKNNVAFA